MGRLIDANRLKEVFSRNVAGGNAYFDLIDNAPTVEAIPKAEYEARLKADVMDMLTELKKEIEEEAFDMVNLAYIPNTDSANVILMDDLNKIIQQKINALKKEDN